MGACKNFTFSAKSNITGRVSYHDNGTNGWHGEWVELTSKNGITFKCGIDGWIDGDDSSTPKYLDFTCKVKVWCIFLRKLEFCEYLSVERNIFFLDLILRLWFSKLETYVCKNKNIYVLLWKLNKIYELTKYVVTMYSDNSIKSTYT